MDDGFLPSEIDYLGCIPTNTHGILISTKNTTIDSATIHDNPFDHLPHCPLPNPRISSRLHKQPT